MGEIDVLTAVRNRVANKIRDKLVGLVDAAFDELLAPGTPGGERLREAVLLMVKADLEEYQRSGGR